MIRGRDIEAKLKCLHNSKLHFAFQLVLTAVVTADAAILSFFNRFLWKDFGLCGCWDVELVWLLAFPLVGGVILHGQLSCARSILPTQCDAAAAAAAAASIVLAALVCRVNLLDFELKYLRSKWRSGSHSVFVAVRFSFLHLVLKT